jgi:hypothetical protein
MITLLNDEKWDKLDILPKMLDDDFYYNYLGTDKALSSSSMKDLLVSPKKFIAPDNLPKQALRDGSLIHLMVLEPEKLSELNIINTTKVAKGYKDAVKEFGENNVYTRSEYNNARYISRAVSDCNEARELLEGCKFEVPGIKMFGDIAVRGKADAMKGKTIIDLKTTSDIEKFKWSAKNFKYTLQAALYLDLFDADEFIFLVVDKNTRDIAIFECSDYFIEQGLQEVDQSLEAYRYWFMQNNMDAINNYVKRGVL